MFTEYTASTKIHCQICFCNFNFRMHFLALHFPFSNLCMYIIGELFNLSVFAQFISNSSLNLVCIGCIFQLAGIFVYRRHRISLLTSNFSNSSIFRAFSYDLYSSERIIFKAVFFNSFKVLAVFLCKATVPHSARLFQQASNI